MKNWFLPGRYYAGLAEIDFSRLVGEGKRFLLLDLDNTLLSHDSEELSEQTKEVFALLRQQFAGICIVSNTAISSRRLRAERIAAALGVPCVCCDWLRLKPRRCGYRQAMRLLGATPEETVMVGDHLFDVIGANRAGVFPVLINPIGVGRWFRLFWLAPLRDMAIRGCLQ